MTTVARRAPSAHLHGPNVSDICNNHEGVQKYTMSQNSHDVVNSGLHNGKVSPPTNKIKKKSAPPPPPRKSSMLIGRNKKPSHNKDNAVLQDTNKGSNVPTKRQNSSQVRFSRPLITQLVQEPKMHNNFSLSQPQLNEYQVIAQTKDRIKSILDTDIEEADDCFSEEYGSGYNPSLMKIDHSNIQKHVVAVTTPIVPPSRMTESRIKFSSDPNLLDGNSYNGQGNGSVSAKGPSVSPENRNSFEVPQERVRSSSMTSTSTDGNVLTNPIARAYREHLIGKMEKVKQQSTSPSPTLSNTERQLTSTPYKTQEDVLSSKFHNLSPSELQALEVPDKAYYPRILPPTNGKQTQQSTSMHNGEQRHNSSQAQMHHASTGNVSVASDGKNNNWSKFLQHNAYYDQNVHRTSYNSLSYNQTLSYSQSLPYNQSQSCDQLSSIDGGVTDPKFFKHSVNQNALSSSMKHQGQVDRNPESALAYAYGTIPRHHQWTNQNEGTEDNHGRYRAHSSSDLDQGMVRESDQQSFQLNRNKSTSFWSLSNKPPHGRSQDMPRGIGGQWLQRPFTKQVSSGPFTASQSVGQSDHSQSHKVGEGGITMTKKSKPPLLPKPSLRQASGVLFNHERATSDPTLKYKQVSAFPPMAGIQWGIGISSSQFNSGPNSEQRSRQTPSSQPQSQPHQPYRQQSGVRRLSTSLLEIHEADEMEEKQVQSTKMKLSDYLSLNSTQFPKRIRVTKGFCSESTEVTMSQGEVFDLHFIKETKALLMADSNAIQYTVPMNTVANFAILYNPFKVERVAMLGFHFTTAGTIMDLKNPPNVVAAMCGFDGGKLENSVEEGEVLILNGIKNVFHGRLLKTFSVKYNTTKYLDEKCLANFTTTPAMLKMTLAQIYEYSIPLPQQAVMYPPNKILNSIPASLHTQPVFLKNFKMVKSVIATASMVPNSEVPTISMSADLDVEVQEVAISQIQSSRMQNTTQMLLESFRNTFVMPYINMPTSTSHKAQQILLTNLDPKLISYDAEVIIPDSITVPEKHKKLVTKNTERGTESKISNVLNSRIEFRLKAIEAKYEQVEMKVLQLSNRVDEVSLKVNQVHTYLSKASAAAAGHKNIHELTGFTLNGRTPHKISNGSSSSDQTFPSVSEDSTSVSPLVKSVSDSKKLIPSGVNGLNSDSIYDTLEGLNLKPLEDDVFAKKSVTKKPPLFPKPKMMQNAKPVNKNTDLTKEGKQDLVTSRDQHTRKNSTKETEEMKEQMNVGRNRPSSHPRELENSKILQKSDNLRDMANKRNDTYTRTTPPPLNLAESTDSRQKNEGSVSSPRGLVTQTSRDSIDLRDYLLPTTPKVFKKQEGKRSSSVTGQDEEFDDVDTEAGILADWCSQIEDELTQLFNESIMS